jgi:hypothetical protein
MIAEASREVAQPSVNGARPHIPVPTTPLPAASQRHATNGTSLRNLQLKAITGKMSGRTTNVFYGVVLTVALIGSGTAAMHWLHWPLPFALAAVGAAELGGVALSMHANERRQLGERAIAAQLLSAAFAGTAVAVNWFGHDELGLSAFFAGFSLLGYGVYLLISSAKRRDYLRASGDLDDPAPVYGLIWWCRHPGITRRARALALANSSQRRLEVEGKPKGTQPVTPILGRLGSLAAARAEIKAERRQAAIATALRKRITEHVGPVMAEIAVQTYDLDEIARRLAVTADYDGLTDIIRADLTPDRIAPTDTDSRGDSRQGATDTDSPADRVSTVGRVSTDTVGSRRRTRRPTGSRPSTRPTRRQGVGGTDRSRLSTVDSPAPTAVTDSPADNADSRLSGDSAQPVGVHKPAAVANASLLRGRYGDNNLPSSVNRVRLDTGWSAERATAAVAAYLDSADRADRADDPTDNTDSRLSPDRADKGDRGDNRQPTDSPEVGA